MIDMFAIRESAKRCWDKGGNSTHNPWIMYELRWCVWMEQWGKCSDSYMDSPNRALDALETGGVINEWISVHERLSEGNGPFLACSINNPKTSPDSGPSIVKKPSTFWHTHWTLIPNLPSQAAAGDE